MKKISLTVIAAALLLAGCGDIETDTAAKQTEKAAAETTTVTTTVTTAEPVKETERETTVTEEATVTEERTAVSTTLPDYVTDTVTREQNASAEVFTDIDLWSDKRELGTDDESSEVIWSANIPVECSPETVLLIDADTEEVAAVLNDIADYEKFGGDIMGDGVYNCRFTVDTDIDETPDTSERKTYSWYAEFADDKGIHRSEPAEITVYEPFTDKELADVKAVSDEIHKLMKDKEFKKLDLEGKCEKMTALLEKLATEGTEERPYPLIIKESIYAGRDTVSYKHNCGIGSAVMLKPFDKRMN